MQIFEGRAPFSRETPLFWPNQMDREVYLVPPRMELGLDGPRDVVQRMESHWTQFEIILRCHGGFFLKQVRKLGLTPCRLTSENLYLSMSA